MPGSQPGLCCRNSVLVVSQVVPALAGYKRDEGVAGSKRREMYVAFEQGRPS